MTQDDVAARLAALAAEELERAKAWVCSLHSMDQVRWLIEICRVMDYRHVLQVLSRDQNNHLSVPDFDIMVRGWNPALGLLLPSTGTGFRGVPMRESTAELRAVAFTLLQQLGRATLLARGAEMISHGMAEGRAEPSHIAIRMSDRVAADHFLDQLETDKLRSATDGRGETAPFGSLADMARVENLDDRIAALVFPWETAHGTMIGYHAESDIDDYFIASVAEETADWRNEAGIHPAASINGVPGSHLVAIGTLLSSFYLKHIRFVDCGSRKHRTANYPMSLTIWKPVADLAEGLASFTGMPREDVVATLRLFVVTREDARYFQHERTPYVPMLIEISEGYWLAPVSSIFRNVFDGIRMLQERRDGYIAATVREPREQWMISELCHLFLGSRYVIIDKPVRLKRNGKTVTDIDAAVLDRTTSTLALFQLKWQDFSTNDLRTQRSKAKNFVERVDAWGRAVEQWIEEFGKDALWDILSLPRPSNGAGADIKLFAVGRHAARFQSYGYSHTCLRVVPCTWPQFVRLRYQVGPADDVFSALYSAVEQERTAVVMGSPLPHQIITGGQKVVFEDLWRTYSTDAGDER